MISGSKIKKDIVNDDEGLIQRARKLPDIDRPIIDISINRENYDVLKFRDIIEVRFPEEKIIKKKVLVI